jgi:FlaA1/EpsC-like NDP-sugar epimerase
VLGSTGSVVPKFREQIARGGPVTVTGPEMRHYFMTIPEATQLVFTGMRPGEKLFEELGTSADQVDRTRHEKVFVGKIPQMAPEKVMASVTRMAGVVRDGDGKAVREELQRLIPEATLSDEAREAAAGRKGKPSGSVRKLSVVPVA